jgi:hypothetical protein
MARRYSSTSSVVSDESSWSTSDRRCPRWHHKSHTPATRDVPGAAGRSRSQPGSRDETRPTGQGAFPKPRRRDQAAKPAKRSRRSWTRNCIRNTSPLSNKTSAHPASVRHEVAGSARPYPRIPATPARKTLLCLIPAYPRSTRGRHARLSRRRSRVRVPSLPLNTCKSACSVDLLDVVDRRLLCIPRRSRTRTAGNCRTKPGVARESPNGRWPAEEAGGRNPSPRTQATRRLPTESFQGRDRRTAMVNRLTLRNGDDVQDG